MKQANWWPSMAGVVLLIIAVRVGLHLPDIDQKVSFLSHRSLLTHGLLLPLLAIYVGRRYLESPAGVMWRMLGIGLCVALAVHLSFDLLPAGWRGFALIKIPFYGQTGAAFSQFWIAASCVAGLYIALRLVRAFWELLPGIAALLTAFAQHIEHAPGEAFLAPLLALMVSAAIAISLPSHAATMIRSAALKGHAT